MHTEIQTGRRARSFVIAELTFAAGLVMLLTALAVAATGQYAETRRTVDARRVLRGVAELSLAQCRAGLPLAARVQPPGWPSAIEVAIERTPGVGPWTGLTRIQLTLRTRGAGARLEVLRVSTYAGEGGGT